MPIKNKKEIIPIMFCFDTNYVIPAAVAIYSLLENANKDYYYKLHILHSDITSEQQQKLIDTLKEFENYYDLEFIDMKNKFKDVWDEVESKIHFSKEALYKLLVASIFPQYDKIIVTDVDVVFLGDISKSYFSFEASDDVYVAGVKPIGALKQFNSVYNNEFDEETIEKFNVLCAGYLVFNLKKMRKDKIEKKCLKFLKENIKKIIFPEQDTLNYCVYGKIKFLPLNYVTCTYMWNLYTHENHYLNDGIYIKKEIIDAMENPIQLHYASTEKPWKYVDCIKSEIWFKYIVKTEFLKDFLNILPYQIIRKENPYIPDTKKNYKIKKYIKHIYTYIKSEPLFFIKKSFYIRVLRKVKKIMNK